MTDFPLPAAAETVRRVREDPNRLGHRDPHAREDVEGTRHGMTGPATKRIIVGYGFWIFLLSDIVMFSCFFAAFAVQRGATAGGPGIQSLVDMRRVGWETGALLLSSYTCGLSFAATNVRSKLWTQVFLLITGLLGLIFVGLELFELIALAGGGVT